MQSWRCSVDLLWWTSSLCGIGIAAPAQPGRRCCRGAKRSAAGMCRRHFPWSASASAQRRRREVIGTRAQQKKVRRPAGQRTGWHQARSVRRHRLQLLDHAGFDEDARLVGRDRHVEHLREGFAPEVRQAARPVCLFGLHATTARRRAAALRVALDQRDKAVVGQLLMLGAQAPAGCRVALHARAQAAIQQDGAGVEASTADKANVLFKRNVRFFVQDDLQLHGRNCPEPSPALRSASSQGSQTAARTQARKARAALDGENAVIRWRDTARPPPSTRHPHLPFASAQHAQAREGRSCATGRSKKGAEAPSIRSSHVRRKTWWCRPPR